MIARPARPHRLVVACAAALSVTIAQRSALAEGDPPITVVVRSTRETGASLLDRVRGQTSDLAVSLREAPADRLEATIDEQLGAARAIARQVDARLVVWFFTSSEGPTDARVVFVPDPPPGRVLTRRLSDEAGHAVDTTEPASAALEEAALVVRQTVRALKEGVTVGVTPDELEKTEPPRAPERPAQPPQPSASASPTAFALGAGWHGAVDGSASTWLHGVTGSFELKGTFLEGGLRAVVGVPSEWQDAYGSVRVSRESAAAYGGIRVAGGKALRLSVGVEVGAVGFHRVTRASGPAVHALPSTWNASVLAGPELRAAFRPNHGHAGFLFVVGADAVPSAPDLGYDAAGAFAPLHQIARVEPRASVVVEWYLY